MDAAAQGRDTGVLLDKVLPHEVILLNALLRKIIEARRNQK
jgi:hypothetical protein